MIRIEVTEEQLKALAQFVREWKDGERMSYADLDFLDILVLVKASKALDSARVTKDFDCQYNNVWVEIENWQEEILK